MTGAEAMSLARRCLRWVEADRARRDHLAIVRAAEAATRTKRPTKAARRVAELEREKHRTLAARAAGLRRGLEVECDRILAKGHDAANRAAPPALELK